MSTNTTRAQISRDPFARETLMRETEGGSDGCRCEWCGQQRIVRGRAQKLFVYFTETDGGSIYQHPGSFCSKSCHDSYHT